MSTAASFKAAFADFKSQQSNSFSFLPNQLPTIQIPSFELPTLNPMDRIKKWLGFGICLGLGSLFWFLVD